MPDIFSGRTSGVQQVVEKVIIPLAGQKHPDARRAKS